MTFRILALVLVGLFFVSGKAQSKMLDLSFGSDGYVEGNQLQGKTITSLAYLRDSSIMAAGTLYNSGKNYGTVSRYSREGVLYTGFGNSGVRNYSLVGNGLTRFTNTLTLKDGHLLITGITYSYTYNGTGTFLLKINAETGEPDTSFAGTGSVLFENYNISQVDFLKEDSSSNILFSFSGPGSGSRIYKYDRFGRADSALMVSAYNRVNKSTRTINWDMLITSDNRYLLCYMGYGSPRMNIDLYESNGAAVKNAAITGKVDYGFSNPYSMKTFRIVPDTDSTFLTLASYIRVMNSNTSQFLNGIQIYKYKYNGDRMLAFGRNGAVTRDIYTGKCFGIDLIKQDNAGRYVVGYNVEDTVFEDGTATPLAFYDAIVCRLKPDGTFDSTFNNTGIFRGFKNKEVGDQLTDIMIGSDNRMLVAGYILWNVTDASQFLCRFKAGGAKYNSGIHLIKGNGVAVYPNPFSDQLNLQGIDGTFHFAIFDITGRKIKEGVTYNNIIASLNDFSAGAYVLRVDAGESRPLIFKIIKE